MRCDVRMGNCTSDSSETCCGGDMCAVFEPDSLATSYSGTQGHKARQIPGQATAFRRSLLLYNAFLQQVSRQALQAASIFYDGETEAQS